MKKKKGMTKKRLMGLSVYKSCGKKGETEWTWPFPIEEAWNVNYFVAKYVLPRIQAFIELEKESKYVTVPGIIHDKYGDEQGLKCWLKYLCEMEYAFEVFSTDRFAFETDENKERVRQGLRLFAEYYEHLWI